MEEKMRREEMELDYLAPFLAQIGNPDVLTEKQAKEMKEDCLADLKQRLIDKANLIQARFEKVRSPFEYFKATILICISFIHPGSILFLVFNTKKRMLPGWINEIQIHLQQKLPRNSFFALSYFGIPITFSSRKNVCQRKIRSHVETKVHQNTRNSIHHGK